MPSARATSRANPSRLPRSRGSLASLSDAKWSGGITSTCVGAWWFKSRNASIPSPRFTTVAATSPAAILQNTQPPAMSLSRVPRARARGQLAPERLAQLLPELFAGVLVAGRGAFDLGELLQQGPLLRRQLGGRPHVDAPMETAAPALAHDRQPPDR